MESVSRTTASADPCRSSLRAVAIKRQHFATRRGRVDRTPSLSMTVAAVATSEEVVAVVAVRPGQTLTLEGLQDFCRERLQPHQLPARLELVESLPRTAMAKIDKPRLRERFWAGYARRIN